MDWNAAIEKNREALKRVLAALVAMAGLGGGAAFTFPLWGGRREASGGGCGPAITPTRRSDDRRPPHKGEVRPEFRPTLPRHLHRAVLRLLRPAEAAARRRARRFARWKARRDAGRIRRAWPLRPGRPPGQRPARCHWPAHEVHDILNDIHGLAFWALERPDTF